MLTIVKVLQQLFFNLLTKYFLPLVELFDNVPHQ